MVFFRRAALAIIASLTSTYPAVVLASDIGTSIAAARGRNSDPEEDAIGALTIFMETTDAGNTIATAVTLPPGTTVIQGSVTQETDQEDLYGFTASQDGFYTFDSKFSGDDAGGGSTDATLMIFNGAGQGLAGDDDSGPRLDSRIFLELTAGEYYFCVSSYPGAAAYKNQADADARIDWFLSPYEEILPGPTTDSLGVIAPYGGFGNPFPLASANYVVTITFAATAAPTVALEPTPIPTSFPFPTGPTQNPTRFIFPTSQPIGVPTKCPRCVDDPTRVTVSKDFGSFCKQLCADPDNIPLGFECGFCE
jgi:hypothetical protein